MERFYGHGKLLLTGEYAVLDGALALALPTRYGQIMEVDLAEEDGLFWKSLDPEGSVWFEGRFYQDDSSEVQFQCESAFSAIGEQLAAILNTAQKLRSEQKPLMFHHAISSQLEFPGDWGLGSSSTLIHNIAAWMGVDPYTLLFETLGGSGYDVACAAADGPILYQLTDHSPSISRVDFDPAFKDELCFVYSGKKQKSSEAIAHYHKLVKKDPEFIATISSLTEEILTSENLEAFEQYLRTHEKVLSEVLQLPGIEQRFPDYAGVLKSLGAWGGDFILATRLEAAKAYFKKKGLTPVIPFSEMIL